MATTRPVFAPRYVGHSLVDEVPVQFNWNPGMAPSQKKKNIRALHEAARKQGFHDLLEISSKSDQIIGQRLSAFNLKISQDGVEIPLECAYQGSKVFRDGGPFTNLYIMSPKEAKNYPRLKNSGDLIGFQFKENNFPLFPKNAFYDWLYINAIFPHEEWIVENVVFDGFTDIEFNPSKSVNCQARAFAEFLSLSKRQELLRSVSDFNHFARLLPPI
jgi:hypothetical protein